MQMFLKAGQKLLDAAIVLSAPRGGRSNTVLFEFDFKNELSPFLKQT